MQKNQVTLFLRHHYPGTPTWLMPELVAEFEQGILMTKSGKVRHPVTYKGGLKLARQHQEAIEEKPLKKKREKVKRATRGSTRMRGRSACKKPV